MFEQLAVEVPLPSKGIFYKDGCDKVKIYHMDASDEMILQNQQLIAQNRVVDELLRKKVHPIGQGQPFIGTEKMLWGDRLTLLIALRCTMEPKYRFRTLHPETNQEITVETDLSQLEIKPFINPNADNLYDFTLPKANVSVKFTLLSADVDKEIRKSLKNDDGKYIMKKLNALVKEVDGQTDEFQITQALNHMPLTDFRALNRYIDEVTPGFQYNVLATVQGGDHHGETVSTFLNIGPSFFYPELI